MASSSATVVKKQQELCLTADRDYEAGEVVMTMRPFVHAVEEKGKYCDYCMNFASDSKPLRECAICLQFYYCSKECQTKDWLAGHKYKECLFYQKDRLTNRSAQINWYARCALRVYLRALANPEFITNKITTIDRQRVSFKDLQDYLCEEEAPDTEHDDALMCHLSKLKKTQTYEDQLRLCTTTSNREMQRGDEIPFKKDTIMKIIALINRKACTSSAKHIRFGQAPFGKSLVLYLELALVSHSCRPNIYVDHVGTTGIVRCTTNINKGERLCHSYINISTISKLTRQQLLERKFNLTCSCQRCSPSGDISELDEREFELCKLKMSQFLNSNDLRMAFIFGVKILKLHQKHFVHCNPYTAHIVLAMCAMSAKLGNNLPRIVDKATGEQWTLEYLCGKLQRHAEVIYGIDFPVDVLVDFYHMNGVLD